MIRKNNRWKGGLAVFLTGLKQAQGSGSKDPTA
jgi:hypothetical protein